MLNNESVKYYSENEEKLKSIIDRHNKREAVLSEITEKMDLYVENLKSLVEEIIQFHGRLTHPDVEDLYEKMVVDCTNNLYDVFEEIKSLDQDFYLEPEGPEDVIESCFLMEKEEEEE